MPSKQKINYTNEIDVSEIIISVWNKKWKIILITALVVLVTAFYQKNSITKYTAETEIKPISNFELFKYGVYNEFIRETNTTIAFQNKTFLDTESSSAKSRRNYRFEGELSFSEIDKKYLYVLFVDAFDDELLKDLIIKFNLVKRKNFESNELYENEILNLS